MLKKFFNERRILEANILRLVIWFLMVQYDSLFYSVCDQSCPIFCNPMDGSLPGSSVHKDSPDKNTRVGCLALLYGIFLTQGSYPGLPKCRQILYQLSYQGCPRILEWVAYPFSRGSSRPRNQTGVSCIAGKFF